MGHYINLYLDSFINKKYQVKISGKVRDIYFAKYYGRGGGGGNGWLGKKMKTDM